MVIFLDNAYKKRIDELGRIVIPKQIREEYNISSFDELDIYIKDGNIVIKKNIGIYQFRDKFNRLLNFLIDKCKFRIIIFTKDKLISSNFFEKEILESKEFLNVIISMSNNVVFKYNEKYLFKDSIIFDSIYLGDILFVSNDNINSLVSEFKKIKEILLDLIK